MLGENWLIFTLKPKLELDAETLILHSGPKVLCFVVPFYKYLWFWYQTEIGFEKVYAVIWPVLEITSLNALLLPVLLCFSHISQFSLGKFQKMGSGSNSQLVPHVLNFLHINPKWFNAFESWKSLGTNCELATESNLWFFTILTLKKGAKTGKSQRVLKALIVLIFEKFQLSASQNNLKFVVGASW